MNKHFKSITWNSLAFIFLGIVVSTFSQAFFLIPNKIVPSGFVGLGTVLYHYAGFPIGIFLLLNNSILIGLQAKLIGMGSSAKTIIAIVVQSLLLDFCTTVWKAPRLVTDPLLACIYGGILTGTGIFLIFKGGATLGGTDIIAQILLKFKHVPAGTTFLWSDIAVLGVAALVYGPNLALYALIKSFIVTKAVDQFLEGSSVYRQVMIMSPKSKAISQTIIENLHRGVTLLNGKGAYTNRPLEIVMTAISRNEMPVLEKLVYKLDQKAFIIVTDARRVLGLGFESLGSVVKLSDSITSDSSDEQPPDRAI